MDGWNTSLSSFLLGWLIFRGELLVSGRVSSRQKGVVFFLGGGREGFNKGEHFKPQHTNLGNRDPFETYAGQIGSFPDRDRGESKTYLKSLPSNWSIPQLFMF